MYIETKRLRIVPLTYNQLQLYIQESGLLERELGLNPILREVPIELSEVFTTTILPAVKGANNYLFSTLWTIILKEEKVMVGDLCFKSEPNDIGEVEIGYGTYPQFQGKGYMAETIAAITDWVLKQDDVRVVIAETDANNVPSHRVLEKCGFIKYKNVDEMIWWRKENH